MKIAAKFIGSSVIVLGLITFVISGSHLLLRQKEESVAEMQTQTQAALDEVLTLQITLRDQVVALKDYVLLEQAATDMASYEKAKSQFLIGLEELERLSPNSEEVALIRRRHEKLVELAESLTNSPTPLAQQKQDIRSINFFGRDIGFYLDSLVKHTREKSELAKQETEEFEQMVQWMEWGTIGLVVVVVIGQFRLIFVPVLRSLRQLQQGASKLGQGRLNYRLNIHSGDEIEQVAGEFNQMAVQLAEFYRTLEEKVECRTRELQTTNESLQKEVCDRLTAQKELQETLKELQQTQTQLIQTEKMSSLGQLVAGIAHEINNPVNFIYGNLTHLQGYAKDLLELIEQYQHSYPNPTPNVRDTIEMIELDYLRDDLPRIFHSMKMGTERIREIVLSLRTFSRLDESDVKEVNIHEGIDSTLLILQNRLKAKPDRPAIEICKEYEPLPLVECYPGQLNQVFMNIIANAIDVLEEKDKSRPLEEIQENPSKIWIRTDYEQEWIKISIIDNGVGIPESVRQKLFDPFFTTKPVGKGTGLGLSISYQIIVERHKGHLTCSSVEGKGTEFVIKIPKKQQAVTLSQHIS